MTFILCVCKMGKGSKIVFLFMYLLLLMMSSAQCTTVKVNQNHCGSKNKQTSSALSVCCFNGKQSAETSSHEIVSQYFIHLSRGGQMFPATLWYTSVMQVTLAGTWIFSYKDLFSLKHWDSFQDKKQQTAVRVERTYFIINKGSLFEVISWEMAAFRHTIHSKVCIKQI